MNIVEKLTQKGFTIIELLIVLIVIGLLSALVITTRGEVIAKNRDVQREQDLTRLQSQLETFYAANTYYPSLADINSLNWRSTHMKTLNDKEMIDPLKSKEMQPVLSASTPSRVGESYGYNVTSIDNSSCEDDDNKCSNYVINAYLETTKSLYSLSSKD